MLLPETIQEFMEWPWERMAPLYEELQQRPLSAETADQWLRDWSALMRFFYERITRLSLDKSRDTTDSAAEDRFNTFLGTIFSAVQSADQMLRLKLLQSGLEPDGMAVPLKAMRSDVALFREANLSLLAAERKLANDYDKIAGAQTVIWDGEERTLTQLKPFYNTPERAVRQQIWQLKAARQLADRAAINTLWQKLLENRQQQATNAGYASYREFRWLGLKRFAYTPQDCQTFRSAIEAVVVPAANRVYARMSQQLGVDRLRPWDVEEDVYPLSFPALRPYTDPTDLDAKAAGIFRQIDPQLGDYFDTMRREQLLDLHNRKGKAPGGFCTGLPVAERPFIFMNAIGSARDVNTMLHEAGHAFHAFASFQLPYVHQMRSNMEFNEVASMAMELLAAPYLAREHGGYYSESEAAHHRLDHLQKLILFWPYMAIVDAFQHWVYENPTAAQDPAACDDTWANLWPRFLPALDWQGEEMALRTGWQRKLHIFHEPFYYVEYGLAQLGAIQVWRNARQNQAEALAQYRQALTLGGTVTLPELYAAAGARFAFDLPIVQEAVTLLEETMMGLVALVETKTG